MKSILAVVFLSLLAVAMPALADVPSFPPQLDGTMMPYNFNVTETDVPWQSGLVTVGNDGDTVKTRLRPVWVNYVARHGARYLSSSKKTESLRGKLKKAGDSGALTAKGESMLRLLDRVDSLSAGKWGRLNTIGIEEEQRLGKELAEICPELFEKGHVDASATYVPRVVMTMYEVCHSLAEYSSGLDIAAIEGPVFNPLLRFFTTDSVYADYLKNGSWRKPYEEFAAKTIPEEPAKRMVKGGYDDAELRKITEDAYGVLQSLRANGMNGDPAEWFTKDEYERCWEVDNLDHYLERSVNRWSHVAANSARPLLKHLMANADAAFAGKPEIGSTMEEGMTGNVAALYFGHAETVMPLFAAMKLPGCYAPKCEPGQVAAVWRDWEVSPLGANLVMVCLKADDGTRYVALRLNGRWIEMFGSRIISWNRLSSLWSNS